MYYYIYVLSFSYNTGNVPHDTSHVKCIYVILLYFQMLLGINQSYIQYHCPEDKIIQT